MTEEDVLIFFSISAAHVFEPVTLIRAVWLSRRNRNVIIILRTRYLESLLNVYSFSTISPEYYHKAERFTWYCCKSSPQGWKSNMPAQSYTVWSLPATQKLCKSMASKHLKQNAGHPFGEAMYFFTKWRKKDPNAKALFIYHSVHKTKPNHR